MHKFDRRSFLKLMGQGTAAVGVGLSAGTPWGKTGLAKAQSTASAKRKYQIFYPGEYLDWEKGVIEERLEQVKKGPQPASGEGQGGSRSAESAAVSETDILNYNKIWDPYNPLFNDKAYAQKVGYPDVPAFPCFQKPGRANVSGIPKDLADLWYYANDGGDVQVWTHIFPGDSFTSEGEKLVFEELTEPGSDLRHFLNGGSGKMYNAKGNQVGWAYGNTRQGYRKIIDGSPKPSFSENMAEWCAYFPEGHYTTDEEWEYIKELWKKEEIRGSQKFYWEDVNIGDEPTWTCVGPVSHMDIALWHGASGTSMRNSRSDPKTMFRDRFGIYMGTQAVHYGGRNIPGARMVFYNHTAAMHIVRMVTNYIGDTGLVTRVCWKFKQFFKEMQVERFQGGEYLDKVPYMKGKTCTVHGSEGDTIIAKGYVTDKYINDRGEHTIDLTCWGETLDNRIIQVVAVSAKLPSRKMNGPSASGGMINIISNEPTHTFEGSVGRKDV